MNSEQKSNPKPIQKPKSINQNPLKKIGYTPYLSVKANEADSSTVIFKAGTVQDPCTALFNLTTTDTSLAVGNYIYDINIELDSSAYTVRKNVFTILDGVKF